MRRLFRQKTARQKQTFHKHENNIYNRKENNGRRKKDKNIKTALDRLYILNYSYIRNNKRLEFLLVIDVNFEHKFVGVKLEHRNTLVFHAFA